MKKLSLAIIAAATVLSAPALSADTADEGGAASDHGADLHLDGLLSGRQHRRSMERRTASGKTALVLSGAGAAMLASSAAARSVTTGNSISSFSASKATSTAS